MRYASALPASLPPCVGVAPIQTTKTVWCSKGTPWNRWSAFRCAMQRRPRACRPGGPAGMGAGSGGQWLAAQVVSACGCMHGQAAELQPVRRQGGRSGVELPASRSSWSSWAGMQATRFPTCSVLAPPPGHVRSAAPSSGAARPSAHSEVLQSCGKRASGAAPCLTQSGADSQLHKQRTPSGACACILLRSPGWTAQQGGTRALLPCREPPPPGPPEQ